jgi:hypothetical protein
MPLLFFDIETEPLPRNQLVDLQPAPVAFDPYAVKAGNIKDPVKLAEKIEACRIAHEADQLRAVTEFYERAALSPVTGRVLAIGYRRAGCEGVEIIDHLDEAKTLTEFWGLMADHTPSTPCGFNCLDFDLPFLVRRSWLHEVRSPKWIREGMWWNRGILDLRLIWTFGDKRGPGSLNDVAKFFGLPPKLGEGKDFSALFHTDKPKAIEYLTRDVNLLSELYYRMQQL